MIVSKGVELSQLSRQILHCSSKGTHTNTLSMSILSQIAEEMQSEGKAVLSLNFEQIEFTVYGCFRNTTQLCDHGTGSPKSVTTFPAAFLYQE